MFPAHLFERAQKAVTAEALAAFAADGALCLRQVLNTDELAILTEGIEANLKDLSPRAKVASRPDDPGYFVEDFCNWQQFEQYQKLLFDSPLPAVAGLLLGSATVRLYHDHLLVKEANTRQKTPWHQDQPYYNIEGRQNISFWIAVDAVPRDQSLEFVAGSHLGPWLMPRSFMDNQAKWFAEGTLSELPAIEASREQFPIIGWAVEPGDIVCFHMLTLHSASGVKNNRRRVFSARYLGDDIIHAPRPWVTSPSFEGLAEVLPDGAVMNHPLFPIAWSADDDMQGSKS
ncbi:MAG: phytanoyl-CoA dioxygenase family protein [Cyanobacteria bacterium REEB67]|nr:phytanoyl-CoA dioxygenase family protein [Cyanobacteria bacterium REEB67]